VSHQQFLTFATTGLAFFLDGRVYFDVSDTPIDAEVGGGPERLGMRAEFGPHAEPAEEIRHGKGIVCHVSPCGRYGSCGGVSHGVSCAASAASTGAFWVAWGMTTHAPP